MHASLACSNAPFARVIRIRSAVCSVAAASSRSRASARCSSPLCTDSRSVSTPSPATIARTVSSSRTESPGIADRLHAQQPEADHAESGTPGAAENTAGLPSAARRHGLGVAGRRGRFGGRPQVADERHDPGEVVEAALVVEAAADGAARRPAAGRSRRRRRSRDGRTCRARPCRAPATGWRRAPMTSSERCTCTSVSRVACGDGARRRDHARHHDEVGVDEPDQHRVADEIDADRPRRRLSRARDAAAPAARPGARCRRTG